MIIAEHVTRSPEDTSALACTIGTQLTKGDVLLLTGEVGAGKTHFARSLIQSLLKEPEDVPSPTFTLVQTYEGPECEIYHADLYRLTCIDEIEELGLFDAFTTGICLIEWPDRLGDMAPLDSLHLEFQHAHESDTRKIMIQSDDTSWAMRLKGTRV